METNVSIMLRNLIYPSSDSTSAIMELTYENKNIKINYPLIEPLKISFSQKFINDKINITLSVLENVNKKNKIISRADLVLNKAIFLEGKAIFEKNLTLIPTDYKDIKKAGKIYIEIKLLDNYEEWKKNIKNFPKKKTNPKFNHNINNENKQNDIEKVEFDDDISLMNLSNIEEIEDINNESNDINELINIDYINQIKNIRK